MKYLSNHEEYNSFLSAGIQEEQTPHVAYIKADNRVIYIARREPVSIAYIATGETGNVISTIEHTKWLDELGTAVGVVVIPQGILPDGKARIMGIKGVDSAGTLSDTEVTMPWGGVDVDVEGLTNYNEVPVVDPETNEITGKTNFPYLPSDKFSTRANPLDIGTAWYSPSSSCAPSPYKDGTLNPAYCATEYTGGTIANALSDFSGLENTQLLCQSAGTYTAANAAHLYKAFAGDTLEWYLPAMGELGFIMPRFNAINEALASVGGVALASSKYFWSSSEYSSYGARNLNTGDGYVNYYGKHNSYRVRPFARL